jgi:hypothetical protein
MSDEAYPTSDTRPRLKDMTPEQRKRYDAAKKAREKELSDSKRDTTDVLSVPLSPLLYGLRKYDDMSHESTGGESPKDPDALIHDMKTTERERLARERLARELGVYPKNTIDETLLMKNMRKK